ncbi:HAD-IIB family hydrolase [Gemella cuniculi]|uniref:HAD-IIB family hydrolase n=1 Tax=Gemella cuniculi TaxID=150240 RepID=UPI00040A0E00|nr:HAD-IIB family hydrolase [Gemella cuniculi]
MKFVFDLDGTICFDGKNISNKIIEILKKAEEYGHEICFASARSYRDCMPVLKDDFKENIVISLNGAAVYKNQNLLTYTPLNKDFYLRILKFCEKYDLPYFIDDYINYVYNKEEEISFFKYVDKYKVAKSLKLDEMLEPIKMAIFVNKNEEIRDQILNISNDEKKVSIMYHEIERAIYINPVDINKANSIINNISPEYVAFGNDKNDIEMIENATYGIQVGEYSELTKVADEIISGANIEKKIADKIMELFIKYQGS